MSASPRPTADSGAGSALKAAAPAGPAPPAGCSHRRRLAVCVVALRMRLEAGLVAAPRGLLGLVVHM